MGYLAFRARCLAIRAVLRAMERTLVSMARLADRIEARVERLERS